MNLEDFAAGKVKELGKEYEHGFHILAGPNNMCLCGVYDGKPTTCSDILSSALQEQRELIRTEIKSYLRKEREKMDIGSEDDSLPESLREKILQAYYLVKKVGQGIDALLSPSNTDKEK